MTLDTDIAVAFITVAGAALVTVLSFVLGVLKERRKTDNATEAAIAGGVKVLLKISLHGRHNHYLRKGWIDLEGLDEAEGTYAAYAALGGNGVGAKRIEEIRLLPTRAPQEEL